MLICIPAVNHDLVDDFWTTWGRGQSVARIYLDDDLLIGATV